VGACTIEPPVPSIKSEPDVPPAPAAAPNDVGNDGSFGAAGVSELTPAPEAALAPAIGTDGAVRLAVDVPDEVDSALGLLELEPVELEPVELGRLGVAPLELGSESDENDACASEPANSSSAPGGEKLARSPLQPQEVNPTQITSAVITHLER
jgi:hypothetical protein